MVVQSERTGGGAEVERYILLGAVDNAGALSGAWEFSDNRLVKCITNGESRLSIDRGARTCKIMQNYITKFCRHSPSTDDI